MATSTYAVAVSFDVPICISVASILSMSYLVVFFYSVIQILQLWLNGSKLSHRKRAFIRMVIFNLVRFVWYAMSSYHLLPENFDTTFVDVEYFSGLSQIADFTTWEVLTHFTFLWPTALLFTANSWILTNWLQLYQTEKLRQKMEPGHSGSLTPLQRRKKAEWKQKKFYLAHIITNLIIHTSVVLLASAHLPSPGPEYDSWNWFMLGFSPEAVLACICAVLLILMTFYCCRILTNLKLVKTSDSDKLKSHTIFTLMISGSLLIYYIQIILFQIYAIYNPVEPNSIQPDSLMIAHALLRAFELIHSVFLLTVLAFPSLSLRSPFPGKTRAITQDWLTNVLRDNGTIKSTTTVIAFSTVSLYGGCHFKVAKVSLTYSVEKPDDPHKTIVVKLLCWHKSIWERIFLYSKYLLGVMDKDCMYLKSYRIESLFYKSDSLDIIRGFHIPETYYNLNDVFNNRFGMVLQDLSKNHDGQPGGFTFDESKRILWAVAEFHAWNRKKKLSKKLAGWESAGYWTGSKCEANKSEVAACWDKVMRNFPELDLQDQYSCFGGLLQDKLKYLDSEFAILSSKKYRTLCHGDFKISNLFVKQPSPNHPDGKVYVIDFQWFGLGNGALDAVYFLYTSLRAEDLPRIPELLSHYYDGLVHFGVSDYPFQEFLHHANIILVDFCVFCICAKYSWMTMTDFKQYEQKVKDGLHLRSTVHMKLILADSYQLVHEWSKRSNPKIKAA